MKKLIKIDGMKCSHCAACVQQMLESIGASGVEIDLNNKTAQFDIEGVSDNEIKTAIEEIGFSALI